MAKKVRKKRGGFGLWLLITIVFANVAGWSAYFLLKNVLGEALNNVGIVGENTQLFILFALGITIASVGGYIMYKKSFKDTVVESLN